MNVRNADGSWRAPVPDITIPEVTLFDFILGDVAADDADRIAAEDAATGYTLTFGQVKQQAESLATWLAAQGIGSGDVVGILLPNCPAYFPAFHGIIRSGAAATMVSPTYVPHEIARQLTATKASVMIVHSALLPLAQGAAALLDSSPTIVVVGDAPSDHVRWAEVVSTPPAPPSIDIDPATHVACLPFSSGTSGLPKAVQLTHRNLVADVAQFDAVLHDAASRDGSFVCFLPYSHIYGLTTEMNYGLFLRMRQYTMATFDPTDFLKLIATKRPTILYIVPPVAAFLARHPGVDQVDFSCVRLAVSGAAALDSATAQALQDRLGFEVIQGYGMTELSPVTHVIRLDTPEVDRGTVGHALPNLSFRIVDPATGRDVPDPAPGEESAPGELWCSGPNAMLGYLGAPASDSTQDADGWIHTGDLAVVSSEGVVRIVGRIKELIKRRGMQVAPAELESVLAEHPAVVDAGVYGVDSRTPGEQIPHAAIVLGPGAEGQDPATLASEIGRWFSERVAPHKRLGGVHVVPSIPRSSAGKILRTDLPEAVAAANPEPQSPSA